MLFRSTNRGKVYRSKVYDLPEMSRTSKGRYLGNVLPLREGERVQSVLATRDFSEAPYLVFATRNGTVKKTPLSEFSYRLARGKIAINLDEGDALVNAELTDGTRDIMLFASNGKAVRFAESEVRSMGRTATGVRGIRLAPGDSNDGEEGEGEVAQNGAKVVSLIVVDGDGDILTASERGYGKRTPVTEYPRKGRGTQGVIALKTTERNGLLVGAVQLSDHHEVLLISDGGTLVRTRAAEISQVGRNTQGVTLIRLPADECLQAIERLDASLDDEDTEHADASPSTGATADQATPPA